MRGSQHHHLSFAQRHDAKMQLQQVVLGTGQRVELLVVVHDACQLFFLLLNDALAQPLLPEVLRPQKVSGKIAAGPLLFGLAR